MMDDDKKWKEEMDANTLAEAAAIRSDKTRLASARRAAKRIADEAMRRAKDATVQANQLRKLAKPDRKGGRVRMNKKKK